MDIDLLSPDFQQDPYPAYDQLRQAAPLVWHAPTRLWYAARYADVSALLRDRRLGRAAADPAASEAAPAETIEEPAAEGGPSPLAGMPAFQRLERHSFFDQEPPDHTRLRGLVSQAFTPRRVEGLRPSLLANARALLEQAYQQATFDLLEDYATPLSVGVIAELLGIPAVDRPRLRPWSAAIVAMYELRPTAAEADRAEQAAGEFWDYLAWLAAQRRATPQDDLISALVYAADPDSGARLSEGELISTYVLLLNAGHEATVNGFGNGLAALLAHPDQLARLRADPTPERIRLAVEEMLRYDTPLQLFRRWVREDLQYGDIHLSAGQRVGLLLGAANRDPVRFEQPQVFDIARQDNPHLSFGAGIHFCLGAPLARLELNIALGELLRRLPWREAAVGGLKESLVIRGRKAIRVTPGQ